MAISSLISEMVIKTKYQVNRNEWSISTLRFSNHHRSTVNISIVQQILSNRSAQRPGKFLLKILERHNCYMATIFRGIFMAFCRLLFRFTEKLFRNEPWSMPAWSTFNQPTAVELFPTISNFTEAVPARDYQTLSLMRWWKFDWNFCYLQWAS